MGVADLFVSGYIHAGEAVISSLGRIWHEGTNNFSASGLIEDLIYANGYVIGVTNQQEIGRSSDGGKTFGADISNNHTMALRCIASGDRLNGNQATIIVGGQNGELSKSTDTGATFGSLISNPFDVTPDDIFGLAHDKDTNTWVLVGDASTSAAWSDDDGDTWNSPTTAPTDNLLRVVSCGNGVFVAGQHDGGSVWRTTDSGDTWSEVVVRSSASGSYGIAFGNNVLVFSCYDTGVYYAYYSLDKGLTWQASTIEGTAIMVAGEYIDDLEIFVFGEHVSFDGGRTFVEESLYGAAYTFPATPDSITYDPVYKILVMGKTSGETYYSQWLEAGAGIVEQGSSSNGEYVIFSNGRVEITMWGFGAGDDSNYYIDDLNNTLPISVTTMESVVVKCVGYKDGSDPSTRWDTTGFARAYEAGGQYDGTYLDVYMFHRDLSSAIVSTRRLVWVATLIGTA